MRVIEILNESAGRVVKGSNTTPDVGVDQISKETKKFGFRVNRDGYPPVLTEGRYFMGIYESAYLDTTHGKPISRREFVAMVKPQQITPDVRQALLNPDADQLYLRSYDDGRAVVAAVRDADGKYQYHTFTTRWFSATPDQEKEFGPVFGRIYRWLKPRDIPVRDPVVEAQDPQDVVEMDIPLLIRLLELSREDIKSDADLHRVVDKIIDLSKESDQELTMDEYDIIEAVLGADRVDEILKRVDGRWALVSRTDPGRVLQYYRGPQNKKPSQEWVGQAERRVHAHANK